MLKHKRIIIGFILFAFVLIVFGGILLMLGAVQRNTVVVYSSICLLGAGLAIDAFFVIYFTIYFIKKYR